MMSTPEYVDAVQFGAKLFALLIVFGLVGAVLWGVIAVCGAIRRALRWAKRG